MAQHNFFQIRNGFSKPLTLNIEPEGAFFPLAQGEQVSITEVYTRTPSVIKWSESAHGDAIVSIWPGDGEVKVEKDGIDVLELIERGAADSTAQQPGAA